MSYREAKEMVDKLEFAIIEAQHKLVNDANKAYVNHLKHELIAKLVGLNIEGK